MLMGIGLVMIVERIKRWPLDRQVVGSNPDRIMPKTSTMISVDPC